MAPFFHPCLPTPVLQSQLSPPRLLSVLVRRLMPPWQSPPPPPASVLALFQPLAFAFSLPWFDIVSLRFSAAAIFFRPPFCVRSPPPHRSAYRSPPTDSLFPAQTLSRVCGLSGRQERRAYVAPRPP
eukprot:3746159-Pleurochrysis_carterae.AAC.1